MAVVHEGFRRAQLILRALRAQSIPLRTGCDKVTRRAKFRFRRRANHREDSRHPVPEEGALAIVTKRWDGIAVDAAVSGVKFVRRAVFRERTAARRTYDAEAY